MPKIRITGINSSTQQVTLSDGGRTEVGSKWLFRTVKWKIDTEDVKSFKIVGKTNRFPFEDPAPTNYSDKVKLKVNWAESDVEWKYGIHWIDKNDNKHESDPIISISPSYLYDENIGKLVPIVLATGLAIFLALKFLGKKRK
jgi:hypothetical protein